MPVKGCNNYSLNNDNSNHDHKNRKDVLDEAATCVCTNREDDYGDPEDSFSLIGKLWSAYLGIEVTSHDVAMLMSLLKIARTKHSMKFDNYVDLAGYAACAGEIAEKNK